MTAFARFILYICICSVFNSRFRLMHHAQNRNDLKHEYRNLCKLSHFLHIFCESPNTLHT